MSGTSQPMLSFAGQTDRAKVVDLGRGFWADAARILPLGDSNTHGWDTSLPETEWQSYRSQLWNLAGQDGLWFDFVGSRSNGPTSLPDRDHEGVSGITSTEVAAHAGQIASSYSPDVVLLMLGTNDALREGNAASTVPGELLAIMRSIDAAQPGVTILLAPLPPIDPWHNVEAVRTAINAHLPGIAEDARDSGIAAKFVPMPDLSQADLTDGVHLTEQGHSKIAAAWHNALLAALPTGNGTYGGERTPITGIRDVRGSELGDSLRGNAASNVLDGRGGADRIDGAPETTA